MTLTASFVANVKPTTNGVKTYGAGPRRIRLDAARAAVRHERLVAVDPHRRQTLQSRLG